MRAALLALTLVLTPVQSGCAAKTVAFSVFAGCQITDYLQTERALERGYVEANPIYGKNPSDEGLLIGKGLALGAGWLAHEATDSPWPLIVGNLPCLWVIHRNHSIGAGL